MAMRLIKIKDLVQVGLIKTAEAFLNIDIQLSPENLYCDGEISQEMAAVKYQRLQKQWDDLEKRCSIKVDRTVSSEDYKAVFNAKKNKGVEK